MRSLMYGIDPSVFILGCLFWAVLFRGLVFKSYFSGPVDKKSLMYKGISLFTYLPVIIGAIAFTLLGSGANFRLIVVCVYLHIFLWFVNLATDGIVFDQILRSPSVTIMVAEVYAIIILLLYFNATHSKY